MPPASHTLADEVDFVSFHFYAPADELPAAYAGIRQITDKPIVLTEFGLPTWNSPFFPNGHSQPEQAVYYADVLGNLRQTDSAGYMAWTLYDFTRVPANVAGGFPWETGPQRKLGVLNENGEPKPAASLLAEDADLEQIIRPPAWARFLKPFWLTVAVLSLIFLVGIQWLWQRRQTIQAFRDNVFEHYF